MKQRTRSILCTLSLLLASCTAGGSNLDAGLFTGRPCAAPCWNNLKPGQSASTLVDEFVNKLNPREWPVRRDIIYTSGCKSILVYSRAENQIVPFWDTQTYLLRFDVNNGKLVFIQSEHPGMPKLEQIVEQLGPPEYVEALNVIGPDGNAYALEVYYPKLGLAAKIESDEKDTGWIKPDMQVQYLDYFPQGDLLSYLTLRDACNLGRDGAAQNAQMEMAKYVQRWPGFGKVQAIQTH